MTSRCEECGWRTAADGMCDPCYGALLRRTTGTARQRGRERARQEAQRTAAKPPD